MGGACSAMGEGHVRVLMEKPEGRRPLGRTGSRWEDNIKMYLQKWDVGGIVPSFVFVRKRRWAGHVARMGKGREQDFGGEA